MKKLIQLFVWLACSLTVIIAAARHSERYRPTPKAPISKLNLDTKKGMDTSVAFPSGRLFKLPKGIVLEQKEIPGYDPAARKYKADNCNLGAGSLVKLCLSLRNQTQEPVVVTLPAGLIFVSLDDKTQNGLLTKDETFIVSAGDTFSFNLALFCLNENRAITKAKDMYKMGPVTDDVDLKAFMEQLQGKNLVDEHYQALVQKTIWEITKGFAPSAAQYRTIAQIPGI